MVTSVERISVEEFAAFVDRPENADRLFEFIGTEQGGYQIGGERYVQASATWLRRAD